MSPVGAPWPGLQNTIVTTRSSLKIHLLLAKHLLPGELLHILDISEQHLSLLRLLLFPHCSKRALWVLGVMYNSQNCRVDIKGAVT